MTEQPAAQAAMYVPKFYLKQRFTLMVNRFEITTANPDGSMGAMLAFCEQKRMALKEQVTFYADESKTTPVFGFKARKVMDLSSGYDVTDAAGAPLGFFQKDFKASLLRSTFHLEGAGVKATGQERNQVIALLRRFTDFSWPIHFDFVAPDGHPVLSVERGWGLRDKYTVTVHDPMLDFRLAAAMAVGQDVLMAR